MALMTSFDNSSQSDFFAAAKAAGSAAESIKPYPDDLILLAWQQFLKKLKEQIYRSLQHQLENELENELEAYFNDTHNATFEMPGNLDNDSNNMRSDPASIAVTLNSRDFLLGSFGYGDINDVFEQCDIIKLTCINLNQL